MPGNRTQYVFRVARTTDIEQIMRLFEDARDWHARMHVARWPVFELDRVVDDLNGARLFVLADIIRVLGTVTVMEEDPLIWNDRAPALYIHRLAVARDLKGADLGRLIVEHVDALALARGKAYLRLDCWADNDGLKSYYERIGFTNLGNRHTGQEPSLPAHYWNSTTTLFQRRVSSRDEPAPS